MKKTKSECDTCPIMGYSPDLCRMHLGYLAKEKKPSSHTRGEPQKSLGRKAAVGAGVGVACTIAGMAIIPAFGVHAMLGHLISAKVAGAGGALGAGANVALNCKKKPNKKRGPFIKGVK